MDHKEPLKDERKISKGKILNLGSGGRPIVGSSNVVNLDMNPTSPYVDKVWDLERGLPFNDNEFDQVICFHIFEHIRNLQQLIGDIWRVTKHNAEIYIDAPHWSNPTFWDDITHVRPWSDGVADKIAEMRFKKDVEGRFEVTLNGTIGKPWDYEKPMCCVVNLKTIKEKS